MSHVAIVDKIHEKINPGDEAKMDVHYETKDGTVNVPAVHLDEIEIPKVVRSKSKSPVIPVIQLHGLFIDATVDGGSEYRNDGDGVFTRTETPSVNQAAQIAIDKKAADEKAKAEAVAKAAADKEAKRLAKEEKQRIAEENDKKKVAAAHDKARKTKRRKVGANGVPTDGTPAKHYTVEVGDDDETFVVFESGESLRYFTANPNSVIGEKYPHRTAAREAAENYCHVLQLKHTANVDVAAAM